MEDASRKTLPPQPGLIAAFATGFELTANHVAVILLPVLLDVFLWLGPHLQIKQIINTIMGQIPATTPNNLISPADIQIFQETMQLAAERFNVFVALRTLPIGVPSLMTGVMPVTNPFGNSVFYQVADSAIYILWWLALTLAGWVLGAIFYYWVARITQLSTPEKPGSAMFRAVAQSILLSIFLAFALLVIGLPISLFLSVIAIISPQIAILFILVGFFIILWILPFLFFMPHGIFAFGQNFLASIKSSFTMARFTLSASGLFVLLMIVFSEGLNFLWRTPPENSWWVLIGILGHAFIATAIMASSFVYYRNVLTWIQLIMEYRKQAAPLRA